MPRRNECGSFPPSRTFGLFLFQVFTADGSCREVVRAFLAWLAIEEGKDASPATGAYCRARNRLSLDSIKQTHNHVCASQDREESWCGRRVWVVDGSSVSMPDTPANQERYPQPTTQKDGCGFPVMRVVAVFSLATGLLLDLAKDALCVHERTLFRRLWTHFEAGDVVLADTGFCSYADFYYLAQRSVDCVMRNHPRRKVGVLPLKKLGREDRLVHWIKSKICPKWLDKEEWAAIPDTLLVREVTITISAPGFRSETIVAVTTLLDAKRFPKEDIAGLYLRRWRAELYLRDIKTALGMDILRCKTPDMIEKELWMHIIAYNLVRVLMTKAARIHGRAVEELSFKGTLATIRQWQPYINACARERETCHDLIARLLRVIARDPIPYRPNRIEPRAKKRRPKNYQLLTNNRKNFQECPHRSRYTKR